jgi:para-aminobenzoate synthetase component 1
VDQPVSFATAVLAALAPDAVTAVVRDGPCTVVATDALDIRVAEPGAGLRVLAEIERAGGWWAGWCAYDLGRAVEAVPAHAADDDPVPAVLFVRFGARLVLAPGRGPRVAGTRRGCRLLRHALEQARPLPHTPAAGPGESCEPTHWRSSLDPAAWAARVAVVHEHLAAGDCYQVNLTRRLTHAEPLDPRALFGTLAQRSPAPHRALVDARPIAGVAVVSASPERFLRRDGTHVETRPIKGTHADPAVLAGSAKDHAENVMIVDLARNDLGRVCEPGSVGVPALCTVEAHPGLHHLVSTVRGRLRSGVGLADLVAATFPPASVTGAPKPRVLAIIEALEPVRRGVYCGAVGWVDADAGIADLNVAIRTFTVTARATHLGVGAGIVADSVADQEWAETELKAHRLLAAAGARAGTLVGAAG